MSTATPPPPPVPPPPKIVVNQTAKRLIIRRAADDTFILGPFETREVDATEFERFEIRRLVNLGMAETVPPPPVSSDDAYIGLIFWAIVGYFIGGGVVRSELTAAKAAGAGFVQLWLMENYWVVAGIVLIVVSVLLAARHFQRGANVMRAVAQWVAFLFTALLSFGVPTFIVYRFGRGQDVLAKGPASAIVGTGLQLLFIAVGSLLPALMYYLFDRQKLGTLRSRLAQQLLRLDPAAVSLGDIKARYGPQMDEVYGSATASDGRLARATRWPILIATILTMAGWMLTLPIFSKVDPENVLSYFIPPHNTVVFAFLGAYVFTLYSILRRYVRGDLKPKAYSAVSVRIFVVMILAWVIDVMFPLSLAPTDTFGELEKVTALGMAFLIGIVPETGLTWIQETIRKHVASFALRIEEKHPLTDLEGIDIYDRGRLLDEGVTNIESLAHCDLIELILDTRIPVPRIVDWVDQAILYLHLATPYASPDSKVESEAQIASLRRTIRNFGIRTATDLQSAFQRANQPDEFLKQMHGEFPATTVEPVSVVLNAMVDDEWFDHVKHWRQNRVTDEFEIKLEPLQIPQ